MTRVGVVGHVEWVDFAVVPALPRPGAIVEATDAFAEPGGGGGVAAVNLARVAGGCGLWTAVGDDALGEAAVARLAVHGVDVRAARRGATRRALTQLSEDDHERTITVVGARLVPHGADELGWDEVAGLDAVYLTGGDTAAARAARAARVVVATPRAGAALRDVEVDVLVASAGDPAEVAGLDGVRRRVTVLTEGARGGRWEAVDGTSGRWEPAPLPGPPVDAYGCGDTFAAVLALGLGAGAPLGDALAFAARCGAAVLTGRGPYAAPLPRRVSRV